MDAHKATVWAQRRLRETGRPIVVAITGELSTGEVRDGASAWSAFVTDGREQVPFTLVGRRSFTDAEDKILREQPRGRWLEGVRESPEVSLLG